jgi:hypothetical protein
MMRRIDARSDNAQKEHMVDVAIGGGHWIDTAYEVLFWRVRWMDAESRGRRLCLMTLYLVSSVASQHLPYKPVVRTLLNARP